MRRPRMPMRWVLCMFLLALALTTRVGLAQTSPAPTTFPTPSSQDLAEAKKHFDIGLKLYNEHACPEARVEFETAYRLAHRYSALKNIAQCDRELKQFAGAYETYQQILDVHSAQLSAADLTTVKRALEELSILVGTLTIKVSEPDADIELDGKSLGKSPIAAAKKVGLGSHVVRATKPTFEPYEKEIAISSEQVLVLDVKLQPEVTTGHLAVREQNGRDVHVFVDGSDKGPSPWEGDLDPGDHTVAVKSDTFASEPRTIKIVRKEQTDLPLDATSLLGRLRVTTLPASASITIDGKSMGTGVWEGDVATGAHHIEVTVAGLPSSVRDVVLQRGQVLVQEIPVAAALAAGQAGPEYGGMYTRVSVLGLISPTTTQVFANGEQDHIHFGLGGTLRIGYSLSKLPFAFEFVGAFMVDRYDVGTPQVSSSSNSGNSNGGTGGVTGLDTFLGLGARVTSHDSTVRFTFGVAPGIAIHSLNVDPADGSTGNNNSSTCTGTTPCSNNSNSDTTFHPGYVAPALMLDGGMLIGNTPGAKFFLGLNAWLDFAPTLNVGPDTQYPTSVLFSGRALQAVSGPQFYFGPTIGVQFGH